MCMCLLCLSFLGAMYVTKIKTLFGEPGQHWWRTQATSSSQNSEGNNGMPADFFALGIFEVQKFTV